jgi:Succinate dehydrogenase/fumarate reductase, flavoprotein subunit
MDRDAYVFRNEEGLRRGLGEIRNLIAMSKDVFIKEEGNVYNQNLIATLEMRNLVELAEVVVLWCLGKEGEQGFTFQD